MVSSGSRELTDSEHELASRLGEATGPEGQTSDNVRIRLTHKLDRLSQFTLPPHMHTEQGGTNPVNDTWGELSRDAFDERCRQIHAPIR